MASPTETAQTRATHVYRSVDGCDIRLDAIGAQAGARMPCAIWIHGGGLIFNSRIASPKPGLIEALLRRGFVVVSIDHRLAPETKLPDIVDDVHHAWDWLRAHGPSRLGIDAGRMTMLGGSSGAYLSLIGGYTFDPPPQAIASLWGFGDITAAWEAEPSAYYRTLELASEDKARASVGRAPVSEPAADTERDWFYLWCRQQGRWLIEVTGHDVPGDAAWFAPYLPVRNIGSGYPPTMLVHGTADNDVPFEESSRLARRLAMYGVRHEFVSLEGVGHGFARATPELIAKTEDAVAAFLAANV